MLLSSFDDSSHNLVNIVLLLDSFTLSVYLFVNDKLLTVYETALALLSTSSKNLM